MNKHLKIFTLFSIACTMSLGGCSCSGTTNDFDFTISLESEKSQIQIGSYDQIKIITNGVEPAQAPQYVYEVNDENVATVSETGQVFARELGDVTFIVTDTVSLAQATLNIEVVNSYPSANGGYNFAAASGTEAIAERTKILGSLEKYAMESHLTGITLFENGGYVKYNPRVKRPTDEYIVGYGFGTLAEGEITDPMPSETGERAKYAYYYHSGSSSDPLTINAANNDGSQVSDLASYITGSYWSTKMNATKDGYDWYPQFAKDTVNGEPFNRPIHQDPDNELGLYKKWRIYVKTGSELKYTTKSALRAAYNGREVAIEDYEFPYRALLTGASKMSRGAQMAGDASYGIKGALQFYNQSKEMTAAQAKARWEQMKANDALGIHTGHDENGDYLDLEIVSPCDEFTAMYALSSSLVSPLPEEFVEDISDSGDDYVGGMKKYGNVNNADIMDYFLCVGAFTVSKWEKRKEIIFDRNDDYFEYPARYHIPGVSIKVIQNANQNPNAIYNEFNLGTLDATGIPTDYISSEVGKPNVLETKGDSTFKLNVNSCSQETWNELFGPNGKIHKNSNWTVKPWMSNEDFLNGLFFSINRPQFAAKRGVRPSINYFSDAYMSDPINGVSYNSTEEHKNAVKAFEVYNGDQNMYGFNYTRAVNCFKRAVNTLLNDGSIKRGDTIKIDIKWMNPTDKDEYGNDIAKYFQDAFNDPAVSGGAVTLQVTQGAASDTNWQQVYEDMRAGEFDLGFGAISGNTYNPLNFLEVLKSDNSSTFTLNWGTDTSVVDERHPLVYANQSWSFDALWAAADHGSVVENGRAVKSVKKSYLDNVKNLSDQITDDFSHGAKFDVVVDFVNVPDVALEVQSIQIYIVGYGNVEFDNVTFTKGENGQVVAHITLDETTAQNFYNWMREGSKIKPEDDTNPFNWGGYGLYWSVEIYYSLSIKGGIPSQTFVTASKNKSSADAEEAANQ